MTKNGSGGSRLPKDLSTLYPIGSIFLLVVCALLLVFSRGLLDRSFIRFHRDTTSIKCVFPQGFNTCQLGFASGVHVSSYEVTMPGGKSDSKAFGRLLKTLEVENSLPKGEAPTSGRVTLDVYVSPLSSPTRIDLTQVRIDEKKTSLRKFFQENLKDPKADYVDHFYLTEWVSDFLLPYNYEVGNLVLAVLSLWLVILFGTLVSRSSRYVITCLRSQGFEKLFQNMFSLPDNPQEDQLDIARFNYGEKSTKKDRYYRFSQLLGPAIGFMLTISSLIAGLHPSLRQAQDITHFFETLQVAMVSTLLGLAVRIIAVFLQKVNHEMFIRMDEAFIALKSAQQDSEALIEDSCETEHTEHVG